MRPCHCSCPFSSTYPRSDTSSAKRMFCSDSTTDKPSLFWCVENLAQKPLNQLRYAQEASWREDNRRQSNGDQVNRLAGLALKAKPSVDFSGYWQRHAN